MDIVTIEDKQFVKYIPAEEIDVAVEKVAARINEDYKDDLPIFLVTLNGAMIFAVDLLKHIEIDVIVSCVKLSSYQDLNSTLEVKDLIGLSEDVTGKRVIIVEDVVDTGLTYEHIVKILEKKKVKDIRIATMTFKPDAYTKNYPVHYVAFPIPDKFVIGRGLDYNGIGRNYPHIYQLKID